jgi:hypothetical protein
VTAVPSDTEILRRLGEAELAPGSAGSEADAGADRVQLDVAIYVKMVPGGGIEPPTRGFSIRPPVESTSVSIKHKCNTQILTSCDHVGADLPKRSVDSPFDAIGENFELSGQF